MNLCSRLKIKEIGNLFQNSIYLRIYSIFLKIFQLIELFLYFYTIYENIYVNYLLFFNNYVRYLKLILKHQSLRRIYEDQ